MELDRYNQEKHTCTGCGLSLFAQNFAIRIKGKSSFSDYCRRCRESTNPKKPPRAFTAPNPVKEKRCSKCNVIMTAKKARARGYCNKCKKGVPRTYDHWSEPVVTQESTPKESKWRKEYNDYMQSSMWRQKRLDYWNNGLYRECYICGDPWVNFRGKEMHHRTYERFQNESLDDLVPLCPKPCHQAVTAAWNEEKKLPVKKRRTLWEVTDAVRDFNKD